VQQAVGLHKSIEDIEAGTLVDDLLSLELQSDDVNNHEHGGYSCGDRSLLTEKRTRQATGEPMVFERSEQDKAGNCFWGKLDRTGDIMINGIGKKGT
jgi:hypothetical protein